MGRVPWSAASKSADLLVRLHRRDAATVAGSDRRGQRRLEVAREPYTARSISEISVSWNDGVSMTGMPRDRRSQKIGRQGPAIAHVWFEKHGLIWRPGDTATDFGVDGELEITAAEVSGLLIKAQIKGVAGASFTAAGVHPVVVKATTMNYWAALHLPVVAFLVDTQTERIYWTQPSPIFDEKTPRLVFRSCPDDDPAAFVGMLRQLAQWPMSSAVLDHVDSFLDVYLDLRSDILGERDRGYDAEPHEVLHIELLYEHVLRLRGLLGLADTPIVPLSAWRSRSDYIDEQHFNQSSTTVCLTSSLASCSTTSARSTRRH